MSEKQIKSVMVFDNGLVACFDPAGQQIPELQDSLLGEWAKRADALGYEVEGLVIEGPGGYRLQLFKTEFGYNIEAA